MLRARFIAAVCLCAVSAVPQGASASGCPGSPNQSVGPDLVVADIKGVANYVAAGNIEAVTLGSDACNLGNAEVNWQACPANTHPIFGANLYRLRVVDGANRFEQIGMSWLKHGTGAAQAATCCPNCQPSGTLTRLGRGCSDAYTSLQSGSQGNLSPRFMVNAHTGVFPLSTCNVHPAPGGTAGRCEVDVADLIPSGSEEGLSYWVQIQYVSADDAAAHNQNNNASCREIAVSGSGTSWNFSIPANSATLPELPAIRMWKLFDPTVIETDVFTPEDDGFAGLVIVSSKATDLGNGFWRYDYAVNNLNSDRSVGAFRVPCSLYADVQNIGFHDVTYRNGDGIGSVNYDGTDWPGAAAGGAVSWATTPFATNPNANAIRWGTLYNFRFDADLPPAFANGQATLTGFKAPVDLAATVVMPTPINALKGDVNEDGLVDGDDIEPFVGLLTGGGGTHVQRCAADVQAAPDGAVGLADVAPFVNCLMAGACP